MLFKCTNTPVRKEESGCLAKAPHNQCIKKDTKNTKATFEQGAVYVEFLIVIMPFLTLFLGLTQLGLIFAADLLVEHAASTAARAAIVILPDDDKNASYANIPVNTVGSAGSGLSRYGSAPAGGRLDEIKKAARLTLSPVSPSIDSLTSGSVASAIGDNIALSFMAGFLGWTRYAVAVTFPDGNGGYKTTFGPKEPVTVRVTYLYKCSIPLAKNLMCSSFISLGKTQRKTLLANGKMLAGISTAAGWSLIALEAERTLPNQGR